MMRSWRPGRSTLLVLAAALLVILAACDDDAGPIPQPVDVETCDELVDIGVQLVRVWVDVLEELPIEQLLADEPRPEFTDLAAIGADLDERAGRLGCDAAQMNVAVRAGLAQEDLAQSDNAVVELLLEIIQGGVVGELPPPPATSTTGASP